MPSAAKIELKLNTLPTDPFEAALNSQIEEQELMLEILKATRQQWRLHRDGRLGETLDQLSRRDQAPLVSAPPLAASPLNAAAQPDGEPGSEHLTGDESERAAGTQPPDPSSPSVEEPAEPRPHVDDQIDGPGESVGLEGAVLRADGSINAAATATESAKAEAIAAKTEPYSMGTSDAGADEAKQSTVREMILEQLADGPVRQKELIDTIGCSASSMATNCRTLVAQGVIEKAGERRRSPIWKLVENFDQAIAAVESAPPEPKASAVKSKNSTAALSNDALWIIEILADGPIELDELVELLGKPRADVSQLLSTLDTDRYVKFNEETQTWAAA